MDTDTYRPQNSGIQRMKSTRPVTLGLSLLASLWLVIGSGCVSNPMPDIPLDSIDAAQVRVDIGSGHDQVLITGLQGAADGRSTRVVVQNLSNADAIEVGVASDGSFSAEIQANASQIFGLTQVAGESFSPTIYVGGNANRDAVEIGTDAECYLLAEPTEEACLVCADGDQAEVFGCDLDDFTDEAVLNQANVAECLFLSTDLIEMYPYGPQFDDFRWDEVNVFNNCGEAVIVEITSLATNRPRRFEVDPWEMDWLWIDPTHFGQILIFYDGIDRGDQTDPDTAELLISVFLPDYGYGEYFLGSLAVEIIAY